MRLPCTNVVFLAAICLSGSVTRGDLILTLDNPATIGTIDVIIQDNVTTVGTPTFFGNVTDADGDPAPGQISPPLSLTVGSFDIDPSSTAFAIGGGPDTPIIDLLLVAGTTGAGDLTANVVWTDVATDFAITQLTGSVGGIGTALDYTMGFDDANSYTPSAIISTTLSGPTYGFSDTQPVSATNPFSLSLTTALQSTGPGIANIGFNAEGRSNDASAVPEPTSLGLWAVLAGVSACVASWRVSARARARKAAAG